MNEEDTAAKRARLDSPEDDQSDRSHRRRSSPVHLFRPYTIKLDFNEWMQEELEELLLLGKFITCTPNGIVALTLHDEDAQLHVAFFNMNTCCQISRIELPSRMEVRYLHAIDAQTILVAGNRFIFEERMAREEPRCFALLLTSDNGFRTVNESDVTLVLPPAPKARYPDFCVTVGNGFVFAMRDLEEMYRKPVDFFYVPFRELCIVGASAEQEKSITASSVGSMKAIGEERFVPIPYNQTSFGVLKGNRNGSKGNRIAVYDIQNPKLSRTIPVVDWPLATSFPPQVAHTVPLNEKRCALLQAVDGAKLILDLKTGGVELIDPFVPSTNASLDLKKHTLKELTASEREAIGNEDSEDDFIDEDFSLQTKKSYVVDALYLTAGWTTVDDSVMMGWMATELVEDRTLLPKRRLLAGFSENMDEDKYSTGAITLMRLPINRVHSLVTLAADAVNQMLPEDTRHQITRETNPKTIPEYVKAIVDFSRNKEDRNGGRSCFLLLKL